MEKSVILILAIGLAFNSCTQELQRPNLLFICSDQQTDKSLEVYGNSQFVMPNLNRLAKESVVFLNTYTSCPSCTPSKGSMLTGLYPQTHGAFTNNVPLPESTQTLPELISTDGQYATSFTGLWHLGDELWPQHGFSQRVSMEDKYARLYSSARDKSEKTSYYKFLKLKGLPMESVTSLRNYASTLPYKLSKTKFLATEACDFLETNKRKPFILYVSFLEPHTPFNGAFNDLHDADALQLRNSINCKLGKDDPFYYRMKAKNIAKENLRKDNQRYAGLCHQVDLSVGQILTKLKDLGLDENTIVVFTSDHGEMMGSHGLMHKTVMYQGSLRVPLLIRVPGSHKKMHAKVVSTPVSNVDLVPTLLDLMGKSSEKKGLQGESLVPMMQGKEPKIRYVFSVWNPNIYGSTKPPEEFENLTQEEINKFFWASFRTVISSDGWKLTLSDVDKNQLFNLIEDKDECNNLYYTSKHEDIVKRLTEQISLWQKRTGDKLKLEM